VIGRVATFAGEAGFGWVEAVGINHVDLSRRAGGADTFPTILGYAWAAKTRSARVRVASRLADGPSG